MKKQTVMWTALPSGISGERLRLSVLVSPRLQTNEGLPRPSLAQFPDFLDWPARAVSFSVAFDGGPTLPAVTVSAPPSSAEWGALFGPSTYVRPYAFPPLHERSVRSFPAANVMAYIKEKYTSFAAANPTDHPHTKDLAQIVRDIGRIGKGFDNVAGPPLDMPTYQEKAAPPGPVNPRRDFQQLREFYTWPKQRQIVPVAVPEIDFHQMVALMGDYPEVMRRVGLIYDLEVELTGTVPPTGTLSVVPTWSALTVGSTAMMPRTAYVIADGAFRAAPRPGSNELENGRLRLGEPEHYSVIQVDVDGAGLKFQDFAQGLLRAQSTRSADTPEQYSVPAMRSHGLSLVRTGRAWNLVQALAEGKARNDTAEGGGAVTLYAEDLTRGYRIDVWDDRTARWHSLCKRVGTYQYEQTGDSFTHEDEGIITMGVTSAADGSSSDLSLHESLLRWEGWSLAAPRPGRVISPQDEVATTTPSTPTEFKLQVSFTAAKGSLPRLRFGTGYRLRARAVDLAGNSAPLTEDDATDANTDTALVRYGRFEPVSSPTMVLRQGVTPGESLERLVIRSNYDAPASGDNDRHIAPPRVAQLTAETHGMFDRPTGLDKTAYAAITARDGGFAPEGLHPEAQLALPYLPDPVARGAALLGLPGAPAATPTQVDFRSAVWPEREPFRLRIAEGSGAPDWNAGARVLTVFLPKAEIAKVRLSSYLGAADLTQMGLWGWLAEAGLPAAKIAALKQLAVQGRHWMLTPYRTLTLVHAVQQPLYEPKFTSLASVRSLGQTFTTLTDKLHVHGKSTIKVGVTARWQEPVDALSDSEWKYISGKADAFEVPVVWGDPHVDISHKQEFGDTKYRMVEYSATATTRFAEYFQTPATATVTVSGGSSASLGATRLVEKSEKVTDLAGTVEYEREKDYVMDYAAGAISRAPSSAIPDGASVKVVFAHYPGPLTRESAAPVTVDVLNSARPASPKVLYIVPTWGWQRESFDDGLVVKRQGGGLRIYMERPWFSSGDGELLGAVLWPGPKPSLIKFPSKVPPDALKPYITQWGLDPLWLTLGSPPALPALAHFKSAVDKATGLTLEEVPGAQFHVAGHAVGYDKGRKLWYCDMELDTGHTYYPFVRLALVRYQPKSVPGAHLSRVVLADFAQVAPDRVATITMDPDDPKLLQVMLCGPGYKESSAAKAPGEVEVTVETKRPDVEGDLGWIPVPGSTFPLTVADSAKPDITWIGRVQLPEARGAKPYRLVIKEYERFRVDGSGGAITGIAFLPKTERRLVFAATVEL